MKTVFQNALTIFAMTMALSATAQAVSGSSLFLEKLKSANEKVLLSGNDCELSLNMSSRSDSPTKTIPTIEAHLRISNAELDATAPLQNALASESELRITQQQSRFHYSEILVEVDPEGQALHATGIRSEYPSSQNYECYFQ